MPLLQQVAKRWLADIYWFSRLVVKRPLYNYQLAPARAIIDSIIHKKGLEFAVMFPRQSGKNETQSQIEAYLLNLFQRVIGAQIVKASPTHKPQSINALMRLERALSNDWNKTHWRRVQGYIVQLGQAAAIFFSAEPSASVVGATASLLLECDEAQDVLEAEWGKKFEPMMASTNATSVMWGTAWTSQTMLARTIRRLRVLEAADGIRRVFIVSPEQVAEENPDYWQFVLRQIAKYGRRHPFVKTQLFNEEIDAEGGMFPPARRALIRGQHPRLEKPEHGKLYAALLDVAGEDEAVSGDIDKAAALENPGRDSTILRIVEVDLSTKKDPLISAPTYRTVHLYSWTGIKHTTLLPKLKALISFWNCVYVVPDATGVGAGIASFLDSALPGRVLPFMFNGSTKSKLGWDVLALADTARMPMYIDEDEESKIYFEQLEFCQYEIIPGPAHAMRWGVPDGTRNPATNELVHDDYIITAALCSVLDEQEWLVLDMSPTGIIQGKDPLEDMRGY